MSKKKNVPAVAIPKRVKEQKEWLTKKGKVTGKTKTQKTVRRGGHLHHDIKNGRMIPTLTPINDKEFYCDECKRVVPLYLFDKDEVKSTHAKFDKIVASGQFYAADLNMGDGPIEYYSNLGALSAMLPKNYAKTAKVVEKNNQLSKKKKGDNKKNNKRSSSSYGRWDV